jgi:hypothetical protein
MNVRIRYSDELRRVGNELRKLSKPEKSSCATCALIYANQIRKHQALALRTVSDVDMFAAIEAGINGPCAWPERE